MSSFEQLFGNSALDVVVPDTSLEYPPQDADEWLDALKDSSRERKQAFFDELLLTFLTVRIPNHWKEEEPDATNPPLELLAFLTHLQISLEASYISQAEPPSETPTQTTHLAAPPKAGSHLRLNTSHHPSIFPPNTPNPTPATGDNDRRYIRSDGTILVAKIWGENTASNSLEAFHLLWSHKEQTWVAVYRLALTVAFLRLPISDPLLCLTLSTTLRDKPIRGLHLKDPLSQYLTTVEGASSLFEDANAAEKRRESAATIEVDQINCFEEVNLLGGLAAGPTFMTSGECNASLPSTRLGSATRQKLFCLPPKATNDNPSSPIPLTTARTAVPTLRKSFRKTLATASGFRVRMRTTFVPTIQVDSSLGDEDTHDAGNEERTVILCIELENADDTHSDVGFSVESVSVNVSGDGATATLIGLGDAVFGEAAGESTFPLLLHPSAQYNLLYAVSFVAGPDENEVNLNPIADRRISGKNLRRAVVIDIHGKPFVESSAPPTDKTGFSYPTNTFSSRWNCVLDLTPQQPYSSSVMEMDHFQASGHFPDALPEPASPFPVLSPRKVPPGSPVVPGTPQSASEPASTSQVAGSKRHTLPGSTALLKKSALYNYRASTSMIQRRDSGTPPPLPTGAKQAYIPPSISINTPRSPAPFSSPPNTSYFANFQAEYPPPTPAYPSFGSQQAIPPSPMSQSPLIPYQTFGTVGPSVDIRRDRGLAPGGVPPTPSPLVMAGRMRSDDVQTLTGRRNDNYDSQTSQSVVVSIGLSMHNNQSSKVHPLDYFTVDIFIYNQSERTRRFEVSYPTKKTRGPKPAFEGYISKVGILPLDNRVRIGPLMPLACQSVRMEFIALSPGVHSIEALTLMDTETGYSINLRSVMDIVVHEAS